MNSLAIFCVLGLFGGLTLASPSSRLPNNLFYIVNLTIAENDAKIDYYSVQVNLTENIFERFTQSLLYKNQLISRTLFLDERNLTNAVFLNFTNTNCIIENDKLPELAAVQGSISGCVNNATKNGSFMFTSVKNNLKQAREENYNIRNTIDTCVTSYTSGYNLTDCVNDT
uniref:Protein TsetseEP domain-containing protein n=1 Tax=Megaselia scalaris TaxID=36166 RepID=T1GA04_MEGSC